MRTQEKSIMRFQKAIKIHVAFILHLKNMNKALNIKHEEAT